MDTVDFRQQFRREVIPAWYLGWAHFGFTSVTCVVIVVYCLGQVNQASILEWMTVPITFLYANLAEYLGHRYPMHHRFPGLKILHRRHVGQHHRFFVPGEMAYDSHRDFKAVLFPPIMIVFFFGVFGVPVGVTLAWVFSASTGYLYVATAIAYFLNYEWLHFAYHCPDRYWVRRIPGMDTLRRLHLEHHDPRNMQHYNFNITYPICDRLFRTRAGR